MFTGNKGEDDEQKPKRFNQNVGGRVNRGANEKENEKQKPTSSSLN